MPFKSKITDSMNLNKKENNIVFTPIVRIIEKYSSINSAINVAEIPSVKKTINKTLNKVSP
tara:strand:+ start:2839 stop:3021 length:183 start_codon:yes stop_codon:yes gene_type:complete